MFLKSEAVSTFVYIKFVKIWKLLSNKYRSSILKENKEI